MRSVLSTIFLVRRGNPNAEESPPGEEMGSVKLLLTKAAFPLEMSEDG